MKRREFIKQSAMGVGALVLAPAGLKAQAAPKTFDPYGQVTLGKTPLQFSRTCIGTGMRGGNRQSNHTRMGKEKLETLLQGSYDRGVRWFDLADLYGTHPYVIPALKGLPREKFGIISKIWFRPGGIPEKERPDMEVVAARFLKELQSDYIDLLLLHCVTSDKWPEELRRQMDGLAKLKEKGLIRAHGVSCHSLAALEAAATESWVDSVHARINHTGASMDGKPEQVLPVLKKLKANGKGVVGMKIIGEGRFGKSDELKNQSIQYVLGSGCVDILNVGFEKLEEVDDFAARVRNVRV